MDSEKRNINWAWFLFSFKGRLSRKPFWIFNMIVFLGAVLIGVFTELKEELNRSQIIYIFWVFWPSLAVQIKRWHDRDKSGLWVAINFIPFVGPVWAIIENGFLPGTKGGNRFGADPLLKGRA